MSGQKIIEGLKQAVAGAIARVTIDGQVWVREKPPAFDLLAKARAEGFAEAKEECAKVAEQFGQTILQFYERPGSPAMGNAYVPLTGAHVAAAICALPVPPQAEQGGEGWQLVPKKLTEEMRQAIENASFGYPRAYERHYQAALAAAPKAST